MSKIELVQVLMALSKLEGYVLGKTGTHIPEDLAEEVASAAEALAQHIKEVS